MREVKKKLKPEIKIAFAHIDMCVHGVKWLFVTASNDSNHFSDKAIDGVAKAKVIEKKKLKQKRVTAQLKCIRTCCDIAIIDILFKITNLAHHIEQQSDRTLELEHFTVQA